MPASVDSLQSEDSLYAAASHAIKSAHLSAVEHIQLHFFINDAIKRAQASRFILSRIPESYPEGAESAEDILRGIKEDLISVARKIVRDDDSDAVSSTVESALYERERNRCCVSGHDTGLKPIFIISPSIVDDEDLQAGGRLRPILDAVLSAEIANELFTFFKSQDSAKESLLKNLWLMSPEVRTAFQNGHIYISKYRLGHQKFIWSVRKRPPKHFSPVNESFHTTPSTPDESCLPLPEGFLLQVHSAASAILHTLSIENEIRHGWAPVKPGRTLGQFGRCLLRGFALMIPNSICVAIYRLILKAVDYWDPQGNPSVKFLPFGLCLKTGRRVTRNEANALRLIEKHTSITAPKLIDFATDSTANNNFLLMTVVPGIGADRVFYRMTYEERRQLAIDVGSCISQYRQIKNDYAQKHLICDTLGGPITDHRTDDRGFCGPYNSKPEFLDDLTEDLESIRTERPLSYLYEKQHEVCFTHSDLHLSNLLVHRGRLCGIIDWENAGFKPEFWEYTRIVWGYKSDHRLSQDFELAFEKSYKEELEAERLLWRLKPVF
ncbi:hypothetical protein BDFG_00360 [Blastomyces dermatitidis ATCC 26199]|nr:hypothetical protein BDFG_00360 [Blastomyces dermatitidis ATCC 26199]